MKAVVYPFKGLVRQARGPRGEGSVDARPTKAKFSTNALNNKVYMQSTEF